MAEYTYKDVIIDPADPRVEIGAEYYAATSISSTLRAANAGNESFLVKLDSVNREPTRTIITAKPFTVSYKQGNGGDTDFIIRKKEPSYEERQAEWVKANNIKVGDKVKVIRKAKDYENGWGNVWDDAMDSGVNEVNEVIDINNKNGIYLDLGDYNFWFPYFVLEKVEEPEFKVGDFVKEKGTEIVGMIIRKSEKGLHIYQNNPYSVAIPHDAGELEPIKAHLKPFDLKYKDTRNMLRAEWIKPKNGEEMDEAMIVGFHSYEKEEAIDLCISCDGFLSPKDALSLWCFLDGSPCGIVVEDKE